MSRGPVIYFCDHCRGAIWFPYGLKMHIGTGWRCWNEHEKSEPDLEPLGPLVDFLSDGASELVEELVDTGVSLYLAWRSRPSDTRMVTFLRKQLRSNRTDVIQGILGYLTTQREQYPGRLLRILTATPEWKRLVARRRRRAATPKAKRMRSSDDMTSG
jgi:hypothetical protein